MGFKIPRRFTEMTEALMRTSAILFWNTHLMVTSWITLSTKVGSPNKAADISSSSCLVHLSISMPKGTAIVTWNFRTFYCSQTGSSRLQTLVWHRTYLVKAFYLNISVLHAGRLLSSSSETNNIRAIYQRSTHLEYWVSPWRQAPFQWHDSINNSLLLMPSTNKDIQKSFGKLLPKIHTSAKSS